MSFNLQASCALRALQFTRITIKFKPVDFKNSIRAQHRHLSPCAGPVALHIKRSATICAANKHDKTQVTNLIDSIVLPRPDSVQHLHAGKGYDYPDTRQEMAERDYQVHITSAGIGRSRPAQRRS